MEGVLRAGLVYIALLILFRVSGRRTLSSLTSFDFVLLLIIGEATQQAILGDDFSLTNCLVVVVTLLCLDIFLAWLKSRSHRVDRLLDGVPTVIVADGVLLRDRMRSARVDESDILHAAREQRGLGRLDQIRYAVLERNGGITVIGGDA